MTNFATHRGLFVDGLDGKLLIVEGNISDLAPGETDLWGQSLGREHTDVNVIFDFKSPILEYYSVKQSTGQANRTQFHACLAAPESRNRHLEKKPQNASVEPRLHCNFTVSRP